MDQSDIQLNKICKLHDSQKIKIIYLASETTQQLDLCSKCVTDHNINGQDLLLVEDLLDACNKEIILNWPPLKNKQISKDFEAVFKQIEETQENIAQFFETFQIDFIKKISDLKKQVFLELEKKNIENANILQNYNQIADKEKLQQLCQDYFRNSDINGLKFREFLNEIYQKSDENQKILNDILERQFQKSNFNQMNELKNLMNQITNSIGECLLAYCQGHKNNQIIKLLKFDLVNLIKSLMDISNAYLKEEEEVYKNKQIDQNQICIQRNEIEYYNDFYLNKIFYQLKQRSFIDIQQMSQIQQLQKENVAQNDKIVSLIKQANQVQKQNQESQIQNQINSFYQQLKHFQDLTQVCEFIQIKKPNNQIHTQFVRNEDTVLKIINLSQTEKTEIQCNKILEFPKDYIIQFKITPFKGFENNYNYEVGFKRQLKSNEELWSINNFFSNNNDYFQDYVEGFKINDQAIRFDPDMRNLALQSKCEAYQIFIYDFPKQNNITKQNFQYNTETPKIFYISFQHIETIEILSFQEISSNLQIN
ncbi:hypothetical protein ABPG72_007326 [Tetrahymena utriculariae]